jgi:hypothetical protein
MERKQIVRIGIAWDSLTRLSTEWFQSGWFELQLNKNPSSSNKTRIADNSTCTGSLSTALSNSDKIALVWPAFVTLSLHSPPLPLARFSLAQHNFTHTRCASRISSP